MKEITMIKIHQKLIVALLFFINANAQSQTPKPIDSILAVNTYLEIVAKAINNFEYIELISEQNKSRKEYTFEARRYDRLDSLMQLAPKYKEKLRQNWVKVISKEDVLKTLTTFFDLVENSGKAMLNGNGQIQYYIEKGSYEKDKEVAFENKEKFIEFSNIILRQNKSIDSKNNSFF